MCAGDDLTLNANVNADSYSWTGPGGFTSTDQNPTRNNVTTGGTYLLTITDNGCTSASGSTTVTINATPAAPNPSNNGPLCAGDDLTFNANVNADSYSWTGPGGFTSTDQNPTRNNVTTGGTYSLTITDNGCTSAAGTTTVIVNATPPTPNPSNSGPLCAGDGSNP